ncbi:MAG: hypothetical protein LBU17_10585 [Treponema sp.]|nr:hypothetical protein [Treponema sp.]
MLSIVKETHIAPDIIIEPTCGVGAILLAAHAAFPSTHVAGIEINKAYCDVLSAQVNDKQQITIVNADIFKSMAIIKEISAPCETCLFIGNPPWVTNAAISAAGGTNLPVKENTRGLRGIDAITGKSNFDISEYIIMKMIETFSAHKSLFAFLCKTTTARNILKQCWNNALYYKDASLFPFDAKKYFSAAVDACFLVMDFTERTTVTECAVYDSIENRRYQNRLGFFQGKMIADIDNFNSYNYLGKSDYIWRNGIKHDCAKVMELDIIGTKLRNGYGETVDIEDTLLFPLLKSSDIANGNLEIRKNIIVPQKRVGEETALIKRKYPKTWKYLSDHITDFSMRKSVVYKNKPLFSIFSVGDYSFSPVKIAISGLYKHLAFRILLPQQKKSVMLDDTCNFIACSTEAEADMIYALLTSVETRRFLDSIIFWDSKRPVTTELLNSIDLKKIARKQYPELRYESLAKKQSGAQIALF